MTTEHHLFLNSVVHDFLLKLVTVKTVFMYFKNMVWTNLLVASLIQKSLSDKNNGVSRILNESSIGLNTLKQIVKWASSRICFLFRQLSFLFVIKYCFGVKSFQVRIVLNVHNFPKHD